MLPLELGRAARVSLAWLEEANDALLQRLFIIRTDEGRDSNTYEQKNKLSGGNLKQTPTVLLFPHALCHRSFRFISS